MERGSVSSPAADGIKNAAGPVPADGLLGSLPPEYGGDIAAELERLLAQRDETLVVLDDDPTGTQTVHGVPVITDTTASGLREALAARPRVLYVSTNSRALGPAEAASLARTLGADIAGASADVGRRVSVVSRSDSTLRGHYPAETDALAEGLGARFDGVVICPFFPEGGRLTIGDVHWVAEGDLLVPAAETEYARDPAFGYASSNLPAWVEEVTAGRWPAAKVASLGLGEIRRGGPDAACRFFRRVSGGGPVVINAAAYSDLRVAVLGMLRAEARGRSFLYRTAASFVKVRGGIADRALLTPAEVNVNGGAGVIAVGSYVGRTTEQLKALRDSADIVEIELSARAAAGGEDESAAEAARVASEIDKALGAGLDAVVYTSRDLIEGEGASAAVSRCLTDALRRVRAEPAFAVLKGGITSHACLTEWLGARKAYVLGQILRGVPVWRLADTERGSGMPVVIFPGNVGGPSALADALSIMRRARGKGSAT